MTGPDGEMNTRPRYERAARRTRREPVRGSSGDRPPARKVDPTRAPSGYDPEVWDAALFFEQAGHSHGCPSSGLPVIYALLERELTRKGWLTGSRWCEPSHWDKDLRRWQNLLREMIRFWWEHEAGSVSPGFEVNTFTDRVTFDAMEAEAAQILGNREALEEIRKLRRGEPSRAHRNVVVKLSAEARAANTARPRGGSR